MAARRLFRAVQVAVGEALAAAMNAMLPGIDANDDRKTRAVFRFYCVVLSSVGDLPVRLPTHSCQASVSGRARFGCAGRTGQSECAASGCLCLQAGESPLPLYTEEWLEELLARIFAILSNLDSPETRSDLSTSGQPKADHDCQSFLLNDDCMFRCSLCSLLARQEPSSQTFCRRQEHALIESAGHRGLRQGLCDVGLSGKIPCRPMIELLLARLPADLRTHAIKRIARFVTSTTLPSVAGETGILCSVPSWIAPQETALHLAAPLLARIEAELPVLQKAAAAPGGMHISKVCPRVSSSPILQACNCSTLR